MLPDPFSPHAILVMRQLSRVWNLSAGDRTDLLGRHSNDCCCRAGEGDKFDLICLMARINVNDRSNVTRLKTLVGNWCGQNDSIVFVNHVGNLQEGMGCDQSWFVCPAVDNPDGPNRRSAPVRANDRSLDSVFGAIAGF